MKTSSALAHANSGPLAFGNRDKAFWALIFIFLTAFFIQSAVSLESESTTWDEPGAIATAYAAFRVHDLTTARERPPLLGLLITWPLRLFAGDPKLPPRPDPSEKGGDLRFSLTFFNSYGNDPVQMTRVARYCVLFLSLFLGGVLALWSRALGGMPAAVLACALFALCPNLLAHSHIAANDMPSTIFVFTALFILEKFWSAPDSTRALWAVISLGLALTAKLSVIINLPLYAGVAAHIWMRAGSTWEKKRLLAHAAILMLTSFFTVGVAMGGRFDYAAYLSGFSKIYGLKNDQYFFYLAGRLSSKPWWYYHLYAAAIKTPLTLLILAASGVLVLQREPKHRRSVFLGLGAVALFVGASCFDRVNLGLRRILPVYPFLILLASQTVRFPVAPALRRRILAALLIFQASSVARAAPHYLSYFNELVGGPARGIYHLDDSNIDWGQGLPALRNWLKVHSGVPVRFVYFGTVNPGSYGVNLPPIPVADICAPQPIVYAISAQHLVNLLRQKGDCSWLNRYVPTERLGGSIYIYDFRAGAPSGFAGDRHTDHGKPSVPMIPGNLPAP